MDFEAAKKQAAEENKSLLVDFTGTDWCGWCIQLDKEVFQHQPFKDYVKDKFVLVELDYPRDKSHLTPEIIEQNNKLKEVYKIQGYPTVLLMDPSGRPFARTGYQEGGPERYNEHLTQLLSGKEAFEAATQKAAKLEGVEKAKALIEALMYMPKEYSSFYEEELQAIYKADPEDSTGFRYNMEMDSKLADLQKSVDAAYESGDLDKALSLIDTFLSNEKLSEATQKDLSLERLFLAVDQQVSASKIDEAVKLIDAFTANEKLDNGTKQEAVGMKIGVFMDNALYDRATTAVDEIIAIDPESPLGQMAKEFKPQIAEFKKQKEQSEE